MAAKHSCTSTLHDGPAMAAKHSCTSTLHDGPLHFTAFGEPCQTLVSSEDESNLVGRLRVEPRRLPPWLFLDLRRPGQTCSTEQPAIQHRTRSWCGKTNTCRQQSRNSLWLCCIWSCRTRQIQPPSDRPW